MIYSNGNILTKTCKDGDGNDAAISRNNGLFSDVNDFVDISFDISINISISHLIL